MSAYLLLLLLISMSSASPLNRFEENNLSDEDYSADLDDMKLAELEKYLDNILEEYYDKYIEPTRQGEKTAKISTYFDENDDEGMLNDMPITDQDSTSNSTDAKGDSASNLQKEREKSKNDWMHQIKSKVLSETGRNNITESISSDFLNKVKQSLFQAGISNPAISRAGPVMKASEYIEKIRSFYPSCDIPRNTDEEIWKDMNTMNLFFNVSYNSGSASGSSATTGQPEETVNIASATLRLYRIPQDLTTNLNINCKSADGPHALSDDDKQIRVSVYWYSRSLKKHKVVKKRLADSHMVPLMDTTGGTQYLEFNIRPATRSWVKGRNLGLGVVVEDMDGTILATEKHFKGLGCDTVGNVSTPKPIPTVVLDSLGLPNRNGATDNGFGRNTNAYNSLMPKIDICVIELPAELAAQGNSAIDAHSVFCRQLTHNYKINTWQRHSGASETGRRIRHQHQSHHTIPSDLRDKITRTQILTQAELETLSRQIQALNATRIVNR